MIKEINVTKDDFIKYNRYICSRISSLSDKSFKPLAINLITWFVLAIVILVIFEALDFQMSQLTWHWPTAFLTSLPFIVFIGIFINNLKKFEKASVPFDNGLLLGNKTIEISDSGIKDITSFGTSEYKWQALQEVIVHEQNVYLLLDTTLAQIIPSSAFNSQAEAEAFAERIKVLHNSHTQ